MPMAKTIPFLLVWDVLLSCLANKGLVYLFKNSDEKLQDITEKHLKLSLGRNKKIQYVQGNFFLFTYSNKKKALFFFTGTIRSGQIRLPKSVTIEKGLVLSMAICVTKIGLKQFWRPQGPIRSGCGSLLYMHLFMAVASDPGGRRHLCRHNSSLPVSLTPAITFFPGDIFYCKKI